MKNLEILNLECSSIMNALLESSNIILITDKKGIIKVVNRRFTEVTGYQSEEVTDKSAVELGFRPFDEIKKIYEQLEAKQYYKGEFENYTKQGNPYYEFVSISPLRDKYGNICYYLKIAEDITHRKETEQALQQAKEAAESASQSKGEFLANMSHELRTPLTGIIGIIELLLSSEVTSEQKKYLSMMKTSTESLLQIINDILDFAKIDVGKLKVSHVSFNLKELIVQTIETFSILALEKKLKITYSFGSNIPTKLIGDPGRLRQILINLIGNALKFTEQGEIHIEVDKNSISNHSIQLEFRVRDTGIGIPIEKLEALFDPFTQLDNSLTRKYSGTGLGLSISKRLVEMMGGSITAKSTVGKGSCFSFSLGFMIDEPLEDITLEVFKTSRNTLTTPLEDKKKPVILLAEDNSINQEVVMRLLKIKHYHVIAVKNGKEALDSYLDHSIDIILMDVQMPEMDGLEATKAIRKKEIATDQHVPIIALTAHVMEEDKHKCLAAGMDAYISKPIIPQILFDTLAKYESIHSTKNSSVDLQHALKSCYGSKELLFRISRKFIVDASRDLNAIRTAIQDKDGEKLHQSAHYFKGSLSYLGAQKGYDLVRDLERMGKSSDFSKADMAYEALRKEVDHIKTYYKNYTE